MGQPSVNESLDLVLEQAPDHLCGHFCGSWWAHKFLIFFFFFFLWSLYVIMIAFRMHLIPTFMFTAKLRRVLVNKLICQWGADLQRPRVAIFTRFHSLLWTMPCLLWLAAACHGSQCQTREDKWQTLEHWGWSMSSDTYVGLYHSSSYFGASRKLSEGVIWRTPAVVHWTNTDSTFKWSRLFKSREKKSKKTVHHA